MRARHWSDRLRSKVNADELEESASALVGVALYTHPGFRGAQRDSLRRQIAEARRFVEERRDRWTLARSPEEAHEARRAGKRALILTLEGAAGTLETEEDLREFIDEAGIRIVTLFHFTDDAFGGAALLPGGNGIINPRAFMKSFLHPRGGEGVRVNPLGLTEKGRWMARELLRRGVWIDLSHASDRSQHDLAPLLEEAGQPLLYTHTMLREFYPGERGVTLQQLEAVGRSGGIVGLIPSDDMMGKTRVEPRFLRHPCHSGCPGGLPAFLTQFAVAARCVGSERVTLGSDINAPLSFLPPEEGLLDIDERGFYRYGQLRTLWPVLEERLDRRADGTVAGMDLETFLSTWARVRSRI